MAAQNAQRIWKYFQVMEKRMAKVSIRLAGGNHVVFCKEGSLKTVGYVFRLPWHVGRVGSKCPPYGIGIVRIKAA